MASGVGATHTAADDLPHLARELIAGPSQQRHIVQFYERSEFLTAVVAQYLGAALARGEPAVVVARDAHLALFGARLRALGYDVDARVGSGALVLLDAEAALEEILVDGMPDRDRFRRVCGGALAVAARTACHARVRAYGEMVDLLWADGRRDAAIALEAHWNELAREHDLSLLCSYALTRFAGEADGAPLLAVCHAHTHVLPTETFTLLEPDARLREVVQLQQRALALEGEIAERKLVEAQLRESLRQRDDFLTVAGHELRTPLTAAQLMLELLTRGRGPSLPDPAPERLSKVSRSLTRLGKLIDGLVDVARFSTGRAQLTLAEIDLAALVRGVVDEQLATVQAAGCSVVVGGDEGGVVGRWDRGRLEQVVTNLVSNAAKYGSGRPIEVRVERGADRARLVVRDHGVGIAPADQRRIFERFERAAPRPEVWGLGLGLWIARQAVEAHGGSIAVESRLGDGATFTVELPYAS